MSAEKFFCGESSAFLFAIVVLFWFLVGVFGSVGSCFNGTFNVAKRHHQCCQS